MKVTLASTSKVVTLRTDTGHVEARVWEGTTDTGIAVHAFITRIAHAIDEPPAVVEQFRAELDEQRTPSADVAAYPWRIIL